MQWVAQYNDGSELSQYNADGSENKYANIDRERLLTFGLFDNSGDLKLAIHLDPGQRLIYRRRVEHRTGHQPITVYMAGWQQTIAGQNVQSIQYLFPDGSIHSAGAWREDHAWFYSIVPVPGEM